MLGTQPGQSATLVGTSILAKIVTVKLTEFNTCFLNGPSQILTIPTSCELLPQSQAWEGESIRIRSRV